MSPDAHFRLAEAGFAAADGYERARPGYPAEAVDALCHRLSVGPGRRVLDVAAGTGKLTRALVATGAEVAALEPLASMRDELARAVPSVRVHAGRAEGLPLADSSFDAVTVAQAFHWFEGPTALREFARVLRPGGGLGLIWNVMDRSVPWVDALQEVIHRHRGASPWYAGHTWRAAFDEVTGFGPLEHIVFENHQPTTVAGVVARVASVSFIATLADEARADVLDAVRSIAVDARADEPGFAIPYVTDVFFASRR